MCGAMPFLSFLNFTCKDSGRVSEPFVFGRVVTVKGDGDTGFGKDGAEMLGKIRAAFVKGAVACFDVPLVVGCDDGGSLVIRFTPERGMEVSEGGKIVLPLREG